MSREYVEPNDWNPPPPPKPKRSGWRWLRRTAITLGVIGLIVALLGTNAWYSIRNRGLAQRERVIAELDASEPGWRFADLAAVRMQNPPPPDENICDLAKRVHGLKSKAFQDWQSRPTAADQSEPNRRLTETELELARAVLENEPEKFALARRIRTCRGGSAPVNWDSPNPLGILLPHCDHLRQTASILELDALLAAHDGRSDDALNAALGILALNRGINDEPLLISQLVRMAITNLAIRSVERTLGLTEVSDAKLAEFQTAIAAEADQPRLLWGLLGERGLMFKLGDNIDNGTIPAREAVNMATDLRIQAPDVAVSVVARSIAPGAQALFLEVMNKHIVAARLPVGPKRTDELKAADKSLDGRDDLEAKAVRLILPAIARVGDADTRTAALCRVTAVSLAWERFRLKQGHYPKSLDELPKELLATVPNDPYTDEPLRYKLTDTGAVVYATGPDQTDDGGKLSYQQLTEKGFDHGFQLFDPVHRNQPAKPKTVSPIRQGARD
jgi:hypothetical protein